MILKSEYQSYFESRLKGRYISYSQVKPLLKKHAGKFNLQIIGKSVLGEDIAMLQLGSGTKKVLAWSQMHGNESTTTKALFDFFNFCAINHDSKNVQSFLNNYAFYVIPILNPDGAERYTRENANGIDLNRDAKNRSQPESKVLRDVFDTLKPQLCLNLHGQRSIFGFETGNPAIVSFLSPAANPEKTVTPARKKAMELIVKLANSLQNYIPGCVGRYDDTFNENCVGDMFQREGVPTILFEAGHYKHDYTREKTRKLIFYSLLEVFNLSEGFKEENTLDYFKLPENKKNYRDIILRNVSVPAQEKPISIAIQFKEVLKDNQVEFIPVLDLIGDLSLYFGHKEIQVGNNEILINNQKKCNLGDEIWLIVNKNNKTLEYFNKKDFFIG